jgi:hydrogenase-4 component E
MPTAWLQFLLAIIFLTIVFLHIAKKNNEAIVAYGIQSAAIVALLFNSFFTTGHISLLFIALLTLVVKAILAPAFFTRLIRLHELTFAVSTYINTPLTLIAVAALTAVAHSEKVSPLTSIIAANHLLLSLALSSLFLSLFLIVNRRGALSQIIGILSFENSIVAFSIFAGLEQSLGLQMGVIFDMFVWIVIATVFVSMLYRHFGSLDVTSLKQLKD